jgi:hypothetical protein
MKITRDVVSDLLPGYFAGEVSADTRALIGEFLSTDPEFARMTSRFQRLFDERAADTDDRGVERKALERARSRAERRQISAKVCRRLQPRCGLPAHDGHAARPAVPSQIALHLHRLRINRICSDRELDRIPALGDLRTIPIFNSHVLADVGIESWAHSATQGTKTAKLSATRA